jgi:hypothetical protein
MSVVSGSDTPDTLAQRAAWLAAARRQAAPDRRPLSAGVSALLWVMRLYVVLMATVIAVQVARLA